MKNNSFFFLTVAFLLLYVGGSEEYGLYSQVTSVLIFFGVSIWLIIRDKVIFVRCTDSFSLVVLCIVVPIVSIINGLFRAADYQIVYGFLFMLTAMALAVLGDRIKYNEMLSAYIFASLIALAFFLVIEFDAFKDALSVQMGKEGLVRFSPFDLHPNLVGHVFGGLMVFLVVKSFYSEGRVEKILFIIPAVISLLFVVAASSRGGLLAGLLAIFITMINGRGLNGRSGSRAINSGLIPVFLLIVFVFLFVVVFGFDDLASLLELDSEHRGMSSGFSGRTDAWPAVIASTFNDGWASFFGFGLRSWNSENMGFPVDNSFIELVNDNGFFIAGAIVFVFFSKINSLRKQGEEGREVFSILAFCLIESFVARYLIGIGNPISIVVLWVLVSKSSENLQQLNKVKYRG